jgi:hypothetical protein
MTSAEVVSLVTALIWPVVVLILAIFYQGAIKDLLKRLKSAQVPGFKGAFDKSAEKVLDKADVALRESNVVDKTVRDPATQLLINQTASQPSWAVHQAWRNIRDAALKATGAKGQCHLANVDQAAMAMLCRLTRAIVGGPSWRVPLSAGFLTR